MERRARKWAGGILAAALLTTGGAAQQVNAKQAPLTAPACGINLRLLVISADGNEQFDFASNPNCSPTACKGAIQTYLDQLGVPYETLIASTGVTSAAKLTSLTIVFANLFDVGGLPALPFLSFGFLVANADLLWTRLRPSSS